MQGLLGKQGRTGGLSQSQGGTTGPQGGRATGQRDRGVDEPTTSKREKINARALSPGRPVSVLTVEGESLAGEVTVKKSREVVEAVRELSREIEKEPLPPEYRNQAELFHEFLLEGGEGGADRGGKQDAEK